MEAELGPSNSVFLISVDKVSIHSKIETIIEHVSTVVQ
jgi:hypothetical protein